MAIRYDKKLENEINRTIKNFNQKISRLEKQERQLLPKKISKKELKENVKNRRELRKELNKMRRFSKRGAEKIIKIGSDVEMTVYEYEEIKRRGRTMKSKLTKEINRMKTEKVKIGGREQATTFAKMGDQVFLNTVERRELLNKNLKNMNKKQIEQYKKLLEKSETNYKYKNTVFKDNYINMLLDNGYWINYDAKKLEEIKKSLKNMNSTEFVKMFNEDKLVKSLTDYYMIMRGGKIDVENVSDDIRYIYDTIYEMLVE